MIFDSKKKENSRSWNTSVKKDFRKTNKVFKICFDFYCVKSWNNKEHENTNKKFFLEIERHHVKKQKKTKKGSKNTKKDFGSKYLKNNICEKKNLKVQKKILQNKI